MHHDKFTRARGEDGFLAIELHTEPDPTMADSAGLAGGFYRENKRVSGLIGI
jgi:hypothetical protein